uniref:Aminotransferase-like plant mobile domain-containing protein n=1 Tax=Oryza rufipogon TaxID=4529 RepID=A0A0E0PXJ0_ORYRU
MASIYRCHVDPLLVAAFLTYWNIDAHTLITSQGEMGYPLHTLYDAMGISFSGRLYEEYIPLPSTSCEHVQILHSIYVSLCPSQLHSSGLPEIFESLSLGNYADPDDPLLIRKGFRVEVHDDRPIAILGYWEISYQYQYPPLVHRAAFIATWLCTYCVPIEDGHFIRPEVFTMAVEIAKGHRHAIGVASMAVLYRALDEVYYNIVTGTTSTRHFIMGWFASFWQDAPMPTSSAQLVACPPFIIDFKNYVAVDIQTAHSFFWEFNNDGTGLRFLDFLGFPHSGEAIYMCDDRTQYRNSRAITVAAIDMLVSCTQPASKLLDDDRMEILDKAVDPEATTRIQQLSSESKKLSMNVEHIITQVSQAVNMNCGAEENSLLKEFDGNNPVTLLKLSDVVSARGLKHVWSEIKAFQELLKQRPVQKDVVLKEISINLDLWSNFFSKPPPEIIRLMEGLRVLKRVLSGEARLPNTNLIPAQQDQINQHVDLLRTAQDKVESSCVALEALTSQYNVEQAVQEGNKRECSRQAQKIRAEIAVLQARLQQVEDAHSNAQHRQDVVTENLNSHLERHRQAKDRKSEIAAHLK